MTFAELEVAEEAARLSAQRAAVRQAAAAQAVVEAREALAAYPAGFSCRAALLSANAEYAAAVLSAAAARAAVVVASHASAAEWRRVMA